MSKDIFLFFISPLQTLFERRGDGKQRKLIYQPLASFIFCKEPAGEAGERRQRSKLCLRSSQSPSLQQKTEGKHPPFEIRTTKIIAY